MPNGKSCEETCRTGSLDQTNSSTASFHVTTVSAGCFSLKCQLHGHCHSSAIARSGCSQNTCRIENIAAAAAADEDKDNVDDYYCYYDVYDENDSDMSLTMCCIYITICSHKTTLASHRFTSNQQGLSNYIESY